MSLYDYIYVDLEKSISLYSQLTGGVVELFEKQSEVNINSDNKRNYDFKVFKHDAGGTKEDKEQEKYIIKPHHSILQGLEMELVNKGYLINLNEIDDGVSLKSDGLRNTLKETLCIKVTGRVVFENYERLKK